MSTDDDRRQSIMGAMGRYFNRVESSKSFRNKEEEKRKYATQAKKKRKSTRGCPSEYQEHTALVGVLRHTGARFLHPNNNARSAVAARRAVSMGMVRGAADLIVFTTPPNRPDRKGICLEIKALDGRPTKDQIDWLKGMHAEGYLCYVVWGADAGVDLLKALGYLKEFKRDGCTTKRERETIPGATSKRESGYQEISSVP
jgi:hypothetical protein